MPVRTRKISRAKAEPVAPDRTKRIDASHRKTWVAAMGIRMTKAAADEVRCEFTVADIHRQPYGIVHGGVHCGVIETIASVGAHLAAEQRGQRVVGLENHTSFIRAARSGRLFGRALPATRGRTTQVWECEVRSENDELVARGTVRLLCLAADSTVVTGK